MPVPFRCPHCGHQTYVADEYVGTSGPCAACHETITITGRPEPQSKLGDDPTTRMLLPVGRSGWAIAAGYAGIFAIFCLIPGPLALILGIVAIRDIRIHPDKHGMGRAVFGIVAGVAGMIGLVFTIIVASLGP